MNREEKVKIIGSFLSAPLILGVPLFLPAGTINYWEGWVFIGVFMVAATWHTNYIMKNSPELLSRRIKAGPKYEKRSAQRIIMSLMTAAFFAILVVAGLDHRFGWSQIPALVVVAANALMVFSFAIFNRVCKENTFASATIEIAEGQKVISTGPYGLVRHPMYSGALVLTLAMPIALGSYWAILVAVAMLPTLLWRIVDEEKLLKTDLAGYSDYCQKVKYRLVPGLY